MATVNLTESWRIDASILSDILPDDADILKPGVTWFRFTGYAGNLLGDTCPTAAYNCGTPGSYRSDSILPTEVGETVKITFYKKYGRGSCDNNCGTQKGRATRSLADRGGVVYIMDVSMDANSDILCGMQ